MEQIDLEELRLIITKIQAGNSLTDDEKDKLLTCWSLLVAFTKRFASIVGDQT